MTPSLSIIKIWEITRKFITLTYPLMKYDFLMRYLVACLQIQQFFANISHFVMLSPSLTDTFTVPFNFVSCVIHISNSKVRKMQYQY